MWGSLSNRHKSRRNQALQRSETSIVAEACEERLVLSGVTLQVPARQDSSIYEVSSGTLSNGAGEFIVTGGPTSGTGIKRGLVQFDLSTINIPSGSTIIDVVLKMNLVNSIGGSAGIGLHKITSPWLEAGSNAPGDETNGGQAHEFDATWKWSLYDGLLWKSAGGDFGSESASAIVDTPGAYEWSGEGLIDDVQSWLDSPTTNFGWMVIGPESAGDVKSFASRQSTNAAIRPVLEISYEEPIVPPTISGRQWNDLDGNGLRTSPTVVSLNLQFSQGRTFFNSYGGNEYWFRSGNDNAWYFLTPDGNLTRWNNASGKLTGTLVENVGPRTWHSPSTLLASSGLAAEPWLNGVTIQLVSSTGSVIDTTISRNIDLNSDGIIQPETESGWYRFGSIPIGQYTVRQASKTGWTHSPGSVPSLTGEAYRLDTTLNLTFSGNTHQNFGGLGERWLQGGSLWYFITPAGNFYQWNGRPVTSMQPLSGTLLSTLSPAFYRDLSLLYAATNPVQQIAAGSTISGLNLSSFQSASFSGLIWNDVNPDGIRNPPEFVGARSVRAPQNAPIEIQNFPWYMALLPDTNGVPTSGTVYVETYYYVKDFGQVYRWTASAGSVLLTTISGKSGYSIDLVTANAFAVEQLVNGATVQLLDEFGNVIATTVTTDKDLNGDGSILSTYESGYYEFKDVMPGKYSIRHLPPVGSVQTTNVDRNFFAAVESLRQQFGFKAATTDSFNFGGRSERWFLSRTNAWFYITPQGTVFEWDKNSGGNRGLVRGRQVAQLSSNCYLNLNLLFSPTSTSRTISSGQNVALSVGSMRVLDSLFASLSGQLN